jgi:hypothetical protein
MKWTPWLFGSLTAVLIAGCGGNKRNTDTGAAAGAASDSSTMQGGAPGTAMDTAGMSARTDTGMTGSMNSDSARTGSRMHNDSSATGKSSSHQ